MPFLASSFLVVDDRGYAPIEAYISDAAIYRVLSLLCGGGYGPANQAKEKKITLYSRVSFSDDVEHRRFEESTTLGDEGYTKLGRELMNDKESEYAASIAAAAFAIYSLEETRAEFERRMVESFREDPSTKPTTCNNQENPTDQFQDLGRLPRWPSNKIENNVVGGGPMMRRGTRPIEISGLTQRSDARTMVTSKADVWEQARLTKINNWYEKMNRKIKEWESEKKKRAGLDMETRKAEIERLQRINLSHYQNKTDQIENIVRGARIQLEEKKKREESNVKHKAGKIKRTGRVPVQCLCFEC